MAKPKSKIVETKKITHKFVTEGEVSFADGIIVINIPDEGEKNLNELVKNFNGEYCKITFQQEDQENIDQNESDPEDE